MKRKTLRDRRLAQIIEALDGLACFDAGELLADAGRCYALLVERGARSERRRGRK